MANFDMRLLAGYVQAKAKSESAVVGQKHDSGTPVGPYGHGNGGLFNRTDMSARIVSAIPVPRNTLLNRIPVIMDQYGMELAMAQSARMGDDFGGMEKYPVTTLTNVTAGPLDQGVLSTVACDDWQTGGDMLLAQQVFPIARKGFKIGPINAWRAGMIAGVSDPLYMELVNQILGGSRFLPEMMSGPLASATQWQLMEIYRRLTATGVSWMRKLSREIWTNVASATSTSNKERNWQGLNALINTGQRDINNVLTPALDSRVVAYNGRLNAANGAFITTLFSTVDAENRDLMLANETVEGEITMHPTMWTEFSKQFGVDEYAYAINRMVQGFSNTGGVIINARDATLDRVRMMNDLVIPINGINYKVFLDEGMPYTREADGSLTSDLAFIPYVLNGQPATYFTPYNQDNANSRAVYEFMGSGNMDTGTSDGGLFRWFRKQTNECVTYNVEMACALVMRATHAAWRITGINYTVPVQSNSPYYNDPYFPTGGTSSTTPTAFFPAGNPTVSLTS
jgi:hypothetical protein